MLLLLYYNLFAAFDIQGKAQLLLIAVAIDIQEKAQLLFIDGAAWFSHGAAWLSLWCSVIQFMVCRGSVGSVSACCKAGPSSILSSAPQGGFSH